MFDQERFKRELSDMQARHVALIAAASGRSRAEQVKTAKRVEEEANAFFARWGVRERLKLCATSGTVADGQHKHGDH